MLPLHIGLPKAFPGPRERTHQSMKTPRLEAPALAAPRHGGRWTSMPEVLVCMPTPRGPRKGPRKPDFKGEALSSTIVYFRTADRLCSRKSVCVLTAAHCGVHRIRCRRRARFRTSSSCCFRRCSASCGNNPGNAQGSGNGGWATIEVSCSALRQKEPGVGICASIAAELKFHVFYPKLKQRPRDILLPATHPSPTIHNPTHHHDMPKVFASN
jgi:hypothetical protein